MNGFRYSFAVFLAGLVAFAAFGNPGAVAQFRRYPFVPIPANPEDIPFLPVGTLGKVNPEFPTPPPRHIVSPRPPGSPPVPGNGQAGTFFSQDYTPNAKNSIGYYAGHQANLTLNLPPYRQVTLTPIFTRPLEWMRMTA